MLIAPNVLHVETEETVIVEAHGHHGPIEATITVLDFPQKKEVLDYTKASLNPENGMMNITKIKVGLGGAGRIWEENSNLGLVRCSVRNGW